MTDKDIKIIKGDIALTYVDWVTSMANGDHFFDEEESIRYELVGKEYRRLSSEPGKFWVYLKLKAV
ncbi:hypothetical protein [Pseudomonas fluorescens]|uniref:Uncharacterized protein n=1 Tax=Pseudomonas fluorescens TaxID=294 RepID=A0A5E7AR08_PSEFL|nr:hypothetical protein [Pseudomonas fluorescens]VVN81065.1 hypothetical protein PS833_01078 [Pseudomonas fluorescens]